MENVLEWVFSSYMLNRFLVLMCCGIMPIVTVGGMICSFITEPVLRTKERKALVKSLIYIIRIIMMTLSILNIFNIFTNYFTDPGVDYGDWIYYGQTAGNKAEGYGHAYDSERNLVYIGEFKNGMRHGEGKLYDTYKVGDKTKLYIMYEGGFKNDKYYGHGKCFEISNDEPVLRFDGEYINGNRVGYSREANVFQDGKKTEMYQGSWADGKKCGYGVTVYYDDKGDVIERYRGTYWDGNKCGKGIWEFIDKTEQNYGKVIYYGIFNNEPAEEGVYYTSSGEVILGGTFDKDGNVKDDDSVVKNWPYPEDNLWN